MLKVKQLFEAALEARDHAKIRAYICLLPDLAECDEVEDYLVSLAKDPTPAHLEAFQSIWVYGAHYFSIVDEKWSFLSEPEIPMSSQPSKEGSSQSEQDHPLASFIKTMAKHSNQKLSQTQAIKLTLPKQAYDQLALMVYALVGIKSTFSDSSLDIEPGTNKVIKGPHLRFVLQDEMQATRLKASLEIFGLSYNHQQFFKEDKETKAKRPMITMPQTAFKQLYRIFNRPYAANHPSMALDKKLATTGDEALSDEHRIATGAILFDHCFNLNMILAQIGKRASTLVPAQEPSTELGHDRPPIVCMLESVEDYLKSWMNSEVIKLVPHGISTYMPSEDKVAGFDRMAKKSSIPLLNRRASSQGSSQSSEFDEPLDLFVGYTDQNKWRLLELCMLPEKTLSRFDQRSPRKYKESHQRGAARQQVEEFINYYQDSLSTYVPESIRAQQEIPAAQPLTWSSLSSSDGDAANSCSQGTMSKSASLSLDEKKLKKLTHSM